MEAIRARARDTEAHCPYCHDGLQDDDRVVACGGCATVYHEDCLRDELGSCANLGCEVRPELGKAFRWGAREDAAGARGGRLTCCDGKGLTPGGIRICLGCGGLQHEHCLARREACCPQADTAPLLQRSASGLIGLLPRFALVWAGLGLLLLFLYGLFAPDLAPAEGPGPSPGWIVAMLIYFAFGTVLFLARFLSSALREKPGEDPPDLGFSADGHTNAVAAVAAQRRARADEDEG